MNAAKASYSYTLSPTGNRTAAVESSGRTLNWSYDGIYRLTNETISLDPHSVNGSVGYGLDPVGNRQSQTSSIPGIRSGTCGYDANDRLSTETYDANGNTLTTGGKTFAYDFENHLKGLNGGAVTIQYDADGNRVSKTVNGVTTQYLVDDLNPTGYAQVVEEVTNGVVTRQYTYGLQRISQNQLISNAWTPSFYGYDGKGIGGTVRLLADLTGTVTDTYDYDAWGNTVNTAGSTLNVYLYRGEQYDPDLDLYYLRARYFNPLTGRFLSRDPEAGKPADAQTLHRYLYAAADPVNKMDPTGRAEVVEATELDVMATIGFNVLFAKIVSDEIQCIWSKAGETLEVAEIAAVGFCPFDQKLAGPKTHPLKGCAGTCEYHCSIHITGYGDHGNTQECIESVVNRRTCAESCPIAKRQVETVIRQMFPDLLGMKHAKNSDKFCHD